MCICVYICIMDVQVPKKARRRWPTSWFWSHHWFWAAVDAGNRTRSFARAKSTLKHWVFYPAPLPYFFEKGSFSHQTWLVSQRLDWLAREPLGSSCFYLYHICLLVETWCQWTELRFSCVHRKHFTPWSIFPAPIFKVFFKCFSNWLVT